MKYEMKERLLEGLQEFDTKSEVAAEVIAEHALQHIHANEVILTLGQSRTVEQFFKGAAEKGLKFQVNAIFAVMCLNQLKTEIDSRKLRKLMKAEKVS